MPALIHRSERSRRLLTAYFTFTVGIVAAAFVAGAIWFCNQSTHLRM